MTSLLFCFLFYIGGFVFFKRLLSIFLWLFCYSSCASVGQFLQAGIPRCFLPSALVFYTGFFHFQLILFMLHHIFSSSAFLCFYQTTAVCRLYTKLFCCETACTVYALAFRAKKMIFLSRHGLLASIAGSCRRTPAAAALALSLSFK